MMQMTRNVRAAQKLAGVWTSSVWKRAELLSVTEQLLGHRRDPIYAMVDNALAVFTHGRRPSKRRLQFWLQQSREFTAAIKSVRMTRIERIGLITPQMSPAHFMRNAKSFPEITTVAGLSKWLGLSVGDLHWFADLKDWNTNEDCSKLRHYSFFWNRKKNGTYRLIEPDLFSLCG